MKAGKPSKSTGWLRRALALFAAVSVGLALWAGVASFEEFRSMWPPCTVAPDRSFQVDYFGGVYVGNTSSLLDQNILCYGAWERSTLYFLRDAAAQLDSDRSVFVDVGANTGSHSLFMAQHVGVVHAFEPYRPVLNQFERSIVLSGVENIEVHPIGLGSRQAVLPFHEPPGYNAGTGSFVAEFFEPNRDQGLQLEVVAGDQYFQDQGIGHVDLVKIDTEGYEKPILKGLAETLASSRPIIVLELTARSGSDKFFGGYEALQAAFPNDYEFLMFSRQYKDSGAYELVSLQIDFGADFEHRDAVALPKEKLPLIRLSSAGDDR